MSPIPEQRFDSYPGLRRQLLSFAVSASRPAELHARFLAGLIDHCCLLVIGIVLAFLIVRVFGEGISLFSALVISYCSQVLYFAALEGGWGASFGKRICGLRVAGTNGSNIKFDSAFLRSSLFNGALLMVSLTLNNLIEFETNSKLRGVLTNPVIWGLAVLFITARKGNGYTAIHDLLSGTRVVEKAISDRRPACVEQAQVPKVVEERTIGHFRILETMLAHERGDLFLGYDNRLRRRVWIRTTPAGTPAIPRDRCEMARTGRLRWLIGQRTRESCWDAYEAPPGKPLLDLLARPQPWVLVRYWLVDLLKELAAGLKDSSLPALTLHRVWITPDNRVKLLEFPIRNEGASAWKYFGGKGQDFATIKVFATEFVAACLEGRTPETAEPAPGHEQAPLPQHAKTFLDAIPAIDAPDDLVSGAEALLEKVAVVSWQQRSILLLACGIPFACVAFLARQFLLTSQQPTPVGECLSACGITWFCFAMIMNWKRSWTWARGPGLLLRGLGIDIVRKDGRSAPDNLINLRRFVTWSPFLLVTFVWAVLVIGFPPDAVLPWLLGKVVMALLISVFAAGVVWSLITPSRTWADRIVGTHLVPV